MKKSADNPFVRTTVLVPKKLHDSLKIMCVLTNTTLSNFARVAFQDKLKELRDNGVKEE